MPTDCFYSARSSDECCLPCWETKCKELTGKSLRKWLSSLCDQLQRNARTVIKCSVCVFRLYCIHKLLNKDNNQDFALRNANWKLYIERFYSSLHIIIIAIWMTPLPWHWSRCLPFVLLHLKSLWLVDCDWLLSEIFVFNINDNWFKLICSLICNSQTTTKDSITTKKIKQILFLLELLQLLYFQCALVQGITEVCWRLASVLAPYFITIDAADPT